MTLLLFFHILELLDVMKIDADNEISGKSSLNQDEGDTSDGSVDQPSPTTKLD